MGRKSKETIEREAAEARKLQQDDSVSIRPPVTEQNQNSSISNDPTDDDFEDSGPDGGPPRIVQDASEASDVQSTDPNANVVQDGEQKTTDASEAVDPVDARPTLSRDEVKPGDVETSDENTDPNRVPSDEEKAANRVVLERKGDLSPMQPFQNAEGVRVLNAPTDSTEQVELPTRLKVVRGVVGSYGISSGAFDRSDLKNVDDDRLRVLLDSGMIAEASDD